MGKMVHPLQALLMAGCLLSGPVCLGQQARIAELRRSLERQTAHDTTHLRQLTDLGEAYELVDPERSDSILRGAQALAHDLNTGPGMARVLLTRMELNTFRVSADPKDTVNVKEALRLYEAADDPVGQALALSLLAEYYYSIEDSAISLGYLSTAEKLLGTSHDDHARATLLSRRAACELNLNMPDSALKHNEQAGELFERCGDVARAIRAIEQRATALVYLGKDRLALPLFLEAARQDSLAGCLFAYGNNISMCGNMFHDMGNMSKAVECYLRAVNVSELLHDPAGMGADLGNAASAYQRMGALDEAMMNYQRAHDLCLQGGHSYWACTSLLGLGGVCLQRGDLDRALAVYRTVIDSSGLKYPGLGSQARSGIGRVHMRMGRYAEAISDFRTALTAFNGFNDLQVKGDDLVQLAQAMFMAGNTELTGAGIAVSERDPLVQQALDSALAIGERGNYVTVQRDAWKALSEFAERQGDPANALSYYKRYDAVKDSLVNTEKVKAVHGLEIQYETDKKVQQIALLAKDKKVQAQEIQKQKLMRNGFMAGFALVALFAGVFFVQRNRINKARKRSEELLLNILPEEVAEELKATGAAQAKHFDTATILFTDFKGFTQLSEQVSPSELVAELNTCFKAFDGIMAKYRIEKIKTIGDAYMAAGGLPDPQHGSPADVVRAALEMQDFMKAHKVERESQGKPYFEMRVGIHSGPVVAGIVGVKKFQYDIWGDTVNTASRMESSGVVGQVNISEATYALVKDAPGLSFSPRGKVQAKGKGEMEMYFVQNAGSAGAA